MSVDYVFITAVVYTFIFVMIASSSPALKSSSMIASTYHVTAAVVSPDVPSHTESSLSPIATQAHSPIAMDIATTSLQTTSSVANGNCDALLPIVKIQV